MGEIESHLNVIRVAVGLPLRTTYGDPVPSGNDLFGDSFVNFSYATGPRSQGGIDVRTLKPLTSESPDYPEFVGLRYGPPSKWRAGQRMSRMMQTRSLEDIHADRKNAVLNNELQWWIDKLVEREHPGKLGGKDVKFQFAQLKGANLQLTVAGKGNKAKSHQCTVTHLGGIDPRGLEPEWHGLSIMCNGNPADTLQLKLYPFAVDNPSAAAVEAYQNEVKRLKKNSPVRFEGTIGKTRAEVSV